MAETTTRRTPASEVPMMASRNDIPIETRERMALLLNETLADVFDLRSQAKQAHWNVKGKDFHQLHLLFDRLAEMLEPFVDETAERVTALGGVARGTVRMAAEASRVPEFPAAPAQGRRYVEALADRFAAVAAHARGAAEASGREGDMATNDLLLGLVREADKGLYLLEAHLQEP